MGIDAATLELILSAPAVTALAGSLALWLRTRRSRIKIRIRADGREVEVDSTNVANADSVIKRALTGSD
jgi:hypothetical protein